jgi:hypothetical protein
MKLSKTILILASLIVTGLFVNAQFVKANSPSGMVIEYNTNSNTLNVTITHSVADPNTHFIETVIIKVNGTIAETHNYTSQPTSNTFLYQYPIDINQGETVEVTAVCNLVGQIIRTITVEDGQQPPPEDPTIPGFCFVGAISALSISFVFFKTKKKIKRVK